MISVITIILSLKEQLLRAKVDLCLHFVFIYDHRLAMGDQVVC